MKGLNLFAVSVLTLTIMLVPLARLPKGEAKQTAAGFVSMPSSVTKGEEGKKFVYNTYVRLYDEQKNTTEKVELREYIYGVVAGECPMLYHEEAIKAQIVAAKTYTLYRMKANANAEYDVTSDPETSQKYITREQAYKNWGSKAEEYNNRLEGLLNEVYNYCVLYNDEPILAVYHAISAGKTEDCKNVWSSALPYLVPVVSEGDKLADGYLSEQKLTLAEANGILKPEGITATELASATATRTDSGNVLAVTVGEKQITGPSIAKMFSLRSNNFDVTLTDEHLIFTVRGYGHQVGLSQNGANYFANQGSSFVDILTHYYSGTEVAEYLQKPSN